MKELVHAVAAPVERWRDALPRFSRLRSWVGKGFWAVVDKGLYGASNLGVNVLLARWSTETDYGAFSVGFAALVLVLAFYIALVTEPMLVFGPDRYQNRVRDYLGVLCHVQVVLGAAIGLILAGVAATFFVLDAPRMGLTFGGLAAAMPLFLFGWLMRQACYVPKNPRLAAAGGLLYATTAFGGIYVLHLGGNVRAWSSLLVIGAAGAIAGLWMAFRLRPNILRSVRSRLHWVVVRRHWQYGRWAAATRIPMRLPGHLVYFLLPALGGLAATGAMKALANLVRPYQQATAALGILLISSFSSISDRERFFRWVRLAGVAFITAGIGYWILLGVMHSTLFRWFYGENYAEYAWLLWLLGLQPLFAGLTEAVSAALRAVERPDLLFWARTYATGATLPVTVGLIVAFGLTGAVVGSAVTALITAATMVWYYRLLRRRSDELFDS